MTTQRDALPIAEAPHWRRELAQSARSVQALERVLALDEDERAAVARLEEQGGLPLALTPHFLNLIDAADPADPLRRQVIPRATEFEEDAFAMADPLGEKDHEPLPNLIHRYPDRVLLLVTDRCAAYCRFCTRKRMVGQGPSPRRSEWKSALDYVRARPAISEVILSGGDALVLDDRALSDLFEMIREIEHVAIIRVATRALTFLPTRITPELVAVMVRAKPVYVMTHFNHPNELAAEALEAIARLVDAGVVVLNQTVLLRGVNDNRDTLATLFRNLIRNRVQPYYLHQCDLAPGTRAFRVPLATAMALHGSLRGHLSGLAIPTFVVDIPGGRGKVPLQADPRVAEDADRGWLRGFDVEAAAYPLDGVALPKGPTRLPPTD
jgi:lysine 2,3-aminomutase